MIRGLLHKSLRETWLMILGFGGGLMMAMALLTYIVPQVQDGVVQILDQMPLIRSLVTAILGTELGDQVNAQMMQAILWVHPVVLSTLWGFEIAFCSRVPAGEIDRGTIDVLLGWPVSRRAIYGCETLVWAIGGLVVLGMGLAGHLAMARTVPVEMRPSLPHVIMVMINLACVYVAVGGLAWLISSCNSRRGRAVGGMFALLLASYLVNFLAQFWAPAQTLAFLSVMEYYRPAVIVQSGQWPLGDMAVLLAVGIVAWLGGGLVFARRSICTV